jgi:DNA-binding transcriptional regulator YiaG
LTTLTTSDLVRLSKTRRIVDGGQLRHVRERAGLTQGEIAEVVGVSTAAVCRWELGDILPRSGHARQLAEVITALEACDAY